MIDIDTYILDENHNTVKVPLLRWAHWFGTHDRHVAFDQTREFDVSTVFLGIDHNWAGKGPPVLFESMTFHRSSKMGEEYAALNGMIYRYASWDDAEAGHKALVKRLQKIEAQVRAESAP